MTIRAVIWDLGGVILRTEDDAPRAELAQRLGMTRAELGALVFEGPWSQRASVGAITTPQLWAEVCDALNLPRAQWDALRREFFGGDRLDAALVDYVRALRPRYRTALLSNAWDDLRAVLTQLLCIDDAFDELIISAEVGLVKPDPRIYQLAVERLGIAPHEAVFVDDLEQNVVGARQTGLHAIHFHSPEQARAEVEQVLALNGRK